MDPQRFDVVIAGAGLVGLALAPALARSGLSVALVETLVHLPSGILPAYSAQPVEFDEAMLAVLTVSDLPADWRADPPPPSTRAVGDEWVRSKGSAVLRVPSVVVPLESNYVFNPRHPDFSRVTIGPPLPFPFDPRLHLP